MGKRKRRPLLRPGMGWTRKPADKDRQRFMDKVSKGEGKDDCWLWSGGKDRNGYGAFWYVDNTYGAHRIAYLFFKGRIRNGNEIDHRCKNVGCVNPAHLRQTSKHKNSVDGGYRRWAKPQPPQPPPVSEDDIPW